MSCFDFSPAERMLDSNVGFREGSRGTHTSRTMMLAELALLLPRDIRNLDRTVVEDNALEKATMAGRRLALQRLRELYALNSSVPVFLVLSRLWEKDPGSLPQLAILAALARDPLLRITAKSVLGLAPGSELMRDTMRYALSNTVGPRLNPATLEKVIRNASSSWAQSGHLEGRTFKRRRRIIATPAAVAFAIWLAQAAGFTGEEILSNGWITTLDADVATVRALVERARAAGLIDVRQMGAQLEIDASRLVTGGAA